MASKLSYALSGLLGWIGEGKLLSEIPSDKRKLYRYALRMGYVVESPIKGDKVVERTGRQP